MAARINTTSDHWRMIGYGENKKTRNTGVSRILRKVNWFGGEKNFIVLFRDSWRVYRYFETRRYCLLFSWRMTKNPAVGRDSIRSQHWTKNLCCFFNLPGFDTVGAYLNFLYFAGFQFHPCVLKIRKKTSRTSIMCVADVISCHRFLPTHFTNSCHVPLQLKI